MKTTPTQYRYDFAERLVLARKAAGYTQEQIAMLLDIRQDAYSKYEGGRGEDPPSILPTYLIPRFCVACHITADWLVSGEGRPPIPIPPARARAAS